VYAEKEMEMSVIAKLHSWIVMRGGIAAAALAAVVGCGGGGASTDVPPRFAPLAAAVEAERVSLNAPGVAVAVVENGKVTFAKGFGSKDPTAPDGDPVEPTTLFRIGSTQKALTAIALLQGVESEAVDLERPIVDYLPGFHLTLTPGPVAAITARHLLTHTSGLHDYLEIAAPADEATDAALAGFLTGRYADVGYVQSPPGAFYAYANPGYMLAGLLAETVTGVPYRTLVHDRVLAPLGMNRTVFLPSEVLADGDYALGQTCDPAADATCANPPGIGPVVRPDTYDNPWGRPAGYAWSSVLDMAKLVTFLVHGDEQVLGRELAAAMTSAQVSMPETGGRASYGFGIETAPGITLPSATGLSKYYALTFIGHDGGIPGYSANWACLPQVDFCFVTLASGDGAFFIRSLVTAIQTLVDLPAPSAPPDFAPRLDRLDAYAGTYVDPFALGTIQISRAGDSLSAFVPTLDPENPIPLTATAVDNFAAPDGTPVTFIPDANGTYSYLYSRPFVAVRTAP
jgi:CubicO group peptidase (beta-lactamase class C family)